MNTETAEAAVLVWAGRTPEVADEALEELSLLAETAGLGTVATLRQTLPRISAATFLGKGKVAELAEVVVDTCAEVVVFDTALSPAQRRNLEHALTAKVIDRSQLILDIFAQRARTKAGKLQVELAQLEYLLPRLTRAWTHLSRIRGGVGTRGPGETQLESDRRQVRERIGRLKERLRDIDRTRKLNRREREAVPFPTVALVGYTNAGKSSLLNRLTGAEAYVADQLFATLDTTARRLDLEEGRTAIVVDTVGFVSNLPHELIEAFKGTLEQVVDADLILHVVDCAQPGLEARLHAVDRVLVDLGASSQPQLMVYNKCDLAGAVTAPNDGVSVSARTGEGVDDLLAAMAQALAGSDEMFALDIPHHDGRFRAWLYENTRVVEERQEEEGSHIVAWVGRKNRGRLLRTATLQGYPIHRS